MSKSLSFQLFHAGRRLQILALCVSELELISSTKLGCRKGIQSVKSAWSSLHPELQDHVLPILLENNKGPQTSIHIHTQRAKTDQSHLSPIIAHSYPCSLFMFVVCNQLYVTSFYSLFGYPLVLPLYNCSLKMLVFTHRFDLSNKLFVCKHQICNVNIFSLDL